MKLRQRLMNPSDVAELTLMSPGDILFLYSDGVYDGTDIEERRQLEGVIRDHKGEPARGICNAILQHALEQDEYLKQIGEEDRIDDKTAFIIKRT
jgi:serine phosphatase RsbU (regulator of sigma subunit)